MQLIRSLIFSTAMYILMAVEGILLAPVAYFSRNGAYWAMHRYCWMVFWLMRVLLNLKVEIRGEVPTGEVIVASKHQSFLDIIILMGTLPRAKFVMKKSIKWMPILGFYAMQIGCAPVDRGKKGETMRKMVENIEEASIDPGQVVIYPQGTRVAPGVDAPYKRGAAVLYEKFNLPVVPASTNAGIFWGRNTVMRYGGTAVLEYLDPIPAGLPAKEFMARLEDQIETASDALLAEGRGQ